MRAGVVVVPGSLERRVTNEDQTLPTPRAETPNRSLRVAIDRLGTHGLAAVIVVLALSVIADGGILMLIAWLS
jgi:hypothetical protein